MKKVALILMVVISNVVLLTSCTDSAEELEVLKQNEINIENKSAQIDKDEIEIPTDKGKGKK